MDLKDCIKLCTKLNYNKDMHNIKWSKVPKNNKPDQYHKKPLPYHMEMTRSLYEPIKKLNKSRKHEKIEGKKNEKFQVSEIRQKIREVGIGWNAINAFEKRYRESQKKYATETININSSESNDSFVTVRTSNTDTDDSFLSTTQDFEYLKISESDEYIQNDILHGGSKEIDRYKRNALMKGIILNKENICPLNSLKPKSNSKETLDSSNGILSDEENLNKNKNKHYQTSIEPAKKKSEQKDHPMLKETQV
ncbi:uncharacterized protein LOC131667900 isoform X2 [Phymastichus coffea]|nr:uncharacterized protein LOC131667900 isoform X2 [Phymastichus coffea]XP_058797644.1 uncharacterized protein LOC131667900 isoform X2 [Phymastichus coffea]